MIIPLESPPKIVLSGNPIVARLASNNFVLSLGTQAIFIFRFTDEEAVDATLAFSSPDAGSFTFAFKSIPNSNSATDLRRKGGYTLQQWMESISASMQGNYYLERHYFISAEEVSGNYAVKLVAKLPGTAWSITPGESTAVNLVVVSNTAGTDRSSRENFRILVETYSKGLANFRLRGKGDLISVNSQGIGIAQVNAYLEENLEQQFAWPVQALSPVGFRNHLAARSYLRYGESFGNPELVYRMVKSPEFITLQGRIPKKRMVEFYNKYPTLVDYFTQTKRFLTWQPLIKEVYAGAPEKLYFMNFREDVTGVKVKVKRVLEDGTSTTFDFTSIFAIEPYAVLEIDCATTVMAAGITNLAELHVWVTTASNVTVSAVQVYLIKKNRPANVQHFLFQNAWGAFDTVAFTGELIEEDKYTRLVEEIYKPQLYNQTQRRFRNIKVDQEELFTSHSGFFTDTEKLLWLDDLLNSHSVYEVINNQLHEVVIEDGTIFKTRSNEFLKAITINYRRFSPEQVYRVAPVPSILDEPLTDDTVPTPQFSAQLVVGLAQQEELYFPGNAWLDMSEAAEGQSQLVITAVLKIENGAVVLLSNDTGSQLITVSADGLEINLIDGSSTYTVELDRDIRGKYILLQIEILSTGIKVYVNGQLDGLLELEEAVDFDLSFTKFGKKLEDTGYFVGRLNEIAFGTLENVNDPELIYALAERYGLPVPGSNWLTEYDDETRAEIISGRLTRDDVVFGYFQLTRAEMPYFDPPPGADVGPYPVLIKTNIPGAVLHFTTNGAEPTTADPVFVEETPVIVSSDTQIKAIAVAEGFLPSQVSIGNFSLEQAPAPTFSPSEGEFISPKPILLSADVEDPTFYYEVNNGDPTTESSEYEEAIVLTAAPDSVEEKNVRAITTAPGYNPSPVAQANYSISSITKGFILEFTVSGDASGRTVTLPFTNHGTYDAYIDWGDGTEASHITAYNSSARTHVYAVSGVYQVQITGLAPGFSFSGSGHRLKCTDIIYWGDLDKFEGFSNLQSGFYGCSNLKSTGQGTIKARSSGGRFLYQCFRDCTSITAITAGIFDDLNGTGIGFDSCFWGCTNLVTIPEDLFKYCTSVSNRAFTYAFYNCLSLEEVPVGLFKYNTGAATQGFEGTFYECKKLHLNQWIFYSDGEQSTRFFNRPTRLDGCFYRTAFTGIQGIAPDLWNCDFGSLTPTKTDCFDGAGNSISSLSNYADIPSDWK